MIKTSPIAPRFVTVPQAIVMFSISKQTLYSLSKLGSVRMAKMGRRTLIEVASVEAHLRANPVVLRDAVGRI